MENGGGSISPGHQSQSNMSLFDMFAHEFLHARSDSQSSGKEPGASSEQRDADLRFRQ